jgi:gamma-glutamylcyclotransferase (GGCT)/AIG2-like uncharacterized protein YtfP
MIDGDKFLLFVYGTLMRDGIRNKAIKDQKFLRDVKTTPEYAMLDLGSYPGLVRVENGGRQIEGELWEIDTPRIELLDQIEGAPNLYRMEEVKIDGEDGPIYAYFFRLRTKNTPIYEASRWDNTRY